MKVSIGRNAALLSVVLLCVFIFSMGAFAQIPGEAPDVGGNTKHSDSEDESDVGSAHSAEKAPLFRGSIPAEEVDYVIMIQDRDGRPLKLDKKSGLRCIPFAYKDTDGASRFDSEVISKAALTYFNFKGEAKTVFENPAKDGKVNLKLAKAKEGGEIVYKVEFHSKDEAFKSNKLLAKYENLSVKAEDKPNEKKAGFRTAKVRLNEVHRPIWEIAVVVGFFFLAVLCAWLVSSKCFFSALVRGKSKSPSSAQTYSIFTTIASALFALLCAAVAWFFPRVSGGFFPYDIMVFSFAAYVADIIMFLIVCKAIDKPAD